MANDVETARTPLRGCGPLSPLYDEALAWAASLHRDQLRKNTRVAGVELAQVVTELHAQTGRGIEQPVALNGWFRRVPTRSARPPKFRDRPGWTTGHPSCSGDLERNGIDVVGTFRTPHVTLAARDIQTLLASLIGFPHQVRANPYHEGEATEED